MKKNFKKIIAAVLALACIFCVGLPASYAVNDVQAFEYDFGINDVSVAPISLAAVNEKIVVTVTATPAEAAEGRFVVATLEDGAEAKIRNNELIFNANGEAKFEITALADKNFKVNFDVADSELSAETVVMVNGISTSAVDDPFVTEVTDVNISQSSAVLTFGNTLQLSANVVPANATNKTIIWTSSKKSVARVDQNGKVTPVAKGNAMIIATSEDGGFNAICNVTVKAREFILKWVVDGVVVAEQKYEEGAAIKKIANPSKKGYTFIGWNPDVPSVMPSYNLTVTAKFSKTPVDYNFKININQPSRTSINYGDSLGLSCSVSGTLPPGTMIVWQEEVEVKTDDKPLEIVEIETHYGEMSCTVRPMRHGTTVVYARILDGADNILAEDFIIIQSNANLFYKIVGTIKGWFGLTKHYY